MLESSRRTVGVSIVYMYITVDSRFAMFCAHWRIGKHVGLFSKTPDYLMTIGLTQEVIFEPFIYVRIQDLFLFDLLDSRILSFLPTPTVCERKW